MPWRKSTKGQGCKRAGRHEGRCNRAGAAGHSQGAKDKGPRARVQRGQGARARVLRGKNKGKGRAGQTAVSILSTVTNADKRSSAMTHPSEHLG